MNKPLLSCILGAGVLALAHAPALANSAVDMAKAHFDAIASGNVKAASADYTNETVFQWIGGPLDGVYHGGEAIAPVWGKFAKALGKVTVKTIDIEEAKNPKGATVIAKLKFVGKKAIPVRYVLVYRNKKLVSEIWQIDPSLKAY